MDSASRHTVLSNLAIIVAEALDYYGLDGRSLIEDVGIDYDAALDPDARIPWETAYRMWQMARDASGDPCFGLVVAERFNPSLLHGLGFAWMASGTLGEAFGRVLRFQKLLSTAADMRAVPDGDEIQLEARLTISGRSHHPAYALSMLAGVVRLCRLTAGHEICPVRAYLKEDRPDCAPRVEAFFGCPVDYGAGFNGLRFTRETLEKEVLTSNPRVARVNDQIVIEYLERMDRDNLVARAKRKIIERLPTGRPRQDEVAADLHMSLRNFQRKLRLEGTGFRELVDEIRKDLALRFIRDPSRPIGAISYSLGYTEPANFTRSFRGWTGMSPREYRESLKADEAPA